MALLYRHTFSTVHFILFVVPLFCFSGLRDGLYLSLILGSPSHLNPMSLPALLPFIRFLRIIYKKPLHNSADFYTQEGSERQ